MTTTTRYPAPLTIPTWPLVRVISGAQTGADHAGLVAAETLGYATGGMVPKGVRTEAGPRPDLVTRFRLVESRFNGYEHRTRRNVIQSDGTLICVFDRLDGGSQLTKAVADANRRPALVCFVPRVDASEAERQQVIADIQGWVLALTIRVLNVAGNRESKAPGIYEATVRLLTEALRVVAGDAPPPPRVVLP